MSIDCSWAETAECGACEFRDQSQRARRAKAKSDGGPEPSNPGTVVQVARAEVIEKPRQEPAGAFLMGMAIGAGYVFIVMLAAILLGPEVAAGVLIGGGVGATAVRMVEGLE